jgi:hypothetical protein
MLEVLSFLWKRIGDILRIKALWEILPTSVTAMAAAYLARAAGRPGWIVLLSCLAGFVAMLITIRLLQVLAGRQQGEGPAPSRGPTNIQEIRGLTVGGDVRVAGRDNIELHINSPTFATGKLKLAFDARDDQCVRKERGIPREYRVKVVNTTGCPARDVYVAIERTVPELRDHVGVRLRRRHGEADESSASLAAGECEYFNLLEYNPNDQVMMRPVMHICHTAKTVPINVAVDNYAFTLKARSNEATSESVTLGFEQLFKGHSQLVPIADGTE